MESTARTTMKSITRTQATAQSGKWRVLVAVLASLVFAGVSLSCGGRESDAHSEKAGKTTVTASKTSKSTAVTTAKTAHTDATKLPLGDGRVTTSGPRRGYVYTCQTGGGGGGGAEGDVPWINGDSFDLTAKATVDGSVKWSQASFSAKTSGGKLRLSGNGLPTKGTTGVFPISSNDDAYQYDRNPNSISSQQLSYKLPASPKRASSSSCLSGGLIGVTTNGVAIFNALDEGNRDAVAHETQDSCDGHPQQSGMYHYHSGSRCTSTSGSSKSHSGLSGYALDGFPIYGKRGSGGKLLANSDLDSCHGHTHTVTLRGKRVKTYHYHITMEYPYTLGCFRGTPVSSGQSGQQPGGSQPGGAPGGGGAPNGAPPPAPGR